jgi:hypothetical protein
MMLSPAAVQSILAAARCNEMGAVFAIGQVLILLCHRLDQDARSLVAHQLLRLVDALAGPRQFH